MIGDFNTVESLLARSRFSCSRLMGLKEELTWGDIKRKYNIEDFFMRDDGPIYSWDNLQDDGTRILARLDRFHLFSSSVQNPSSHIMH